MDSARESILRKMFDAKMRLADRHHLGLAGVDEALKELGMEDPEEFIERYRGAALEIGSPDGTSEAFGSGPYEPQQGEVLAGRALEIPQESEIPHG